MQSRFAYGLAAFAFLGAAPSGDQPTPETPPSAKSVERAKELRAGIASFRLTLVYFGPEDKPFYRLTLSVQPIEQLRSSPFDRIEQISEAQAEKIVRQLVADGFFDRATDDRRQDIALRAPKGPTYVLTVNCSVPNQGLVQFHEDLGWNLAMLKRLDALKAVLGEKPAEALGRLLDRLSGLRSEWEKAAAG